MTCNNLPDSSDSVKKIGSRIMCCFRKVGLVSTDFVAKSQLMACKDATGTIYGYLLNESSFFINI